MIDLIEKIEAEYERVEGLIRQAKEENANYDVIRCLNNASTQLHEAKLNAEFKENLSCETCKFYPVDYDYYCSTCKNFSKFEIHYA